MKKKKVAISTEYPANENVHALSNYVVQELFGKYAIYGIAKLITCNRENEPIQNLDLLEVHGKIAGRGLHNLGSDTWELLECEVIIIPRSRLLQTSKQNGHDMGKMTAQQIYLGSDLLAKGKDSYLIRDDPDTTAYDREYIEVVKLS